MIFPDYWLCKNCKKPFIAHLKIGEFSTSIGGLNTKNSKNWCYGEEDNENFNNFYLDYFEPMDNLTLVEEVANQKNLK